MRREFWCPLYRDFGGPPLAQFFRPGGPVPNHWGFVWDVAGIAWSGICSSLGVWEGVGAELGGFYRGYFALLTTSDLFENVCECSGVW